MAGDTEQAAQTLCPPGNQVESPGHISGRMWHPLLKRADFLRLGASKIRRVTPGFILQTAPNTDETSPRLRVGFTASRKVGNAVARNRVKRRLRALADKVMPAIANPANDYVFIGRTEALNRVFAVMEQDLRHALKKLTERRR